MATKVTYGDGLTTVVPSHYIGDEILGAGLTPVSDEPAPKKTTTKEPVAPITTTTEG